MLKVFQCPHCAKSIETNQKPGTEIPCPYCDETFTLRKAHEVHKNTASELLFRIAIPLGYVVFVAVPLGLTIWFIVQWAEKKQRESVSTPAPIVEPKPDEPPPIDPNPKPPEPGVGSILSAGASLVFGSKGPEPKEIEPKEIEPKDTDPSPKPKPEVAIAPEPREVPLVAVAPEPRAVYWKVPESEYSSAWKKVGSVDIRIVGLAVTKVPVVDTEDRITELDAPLLAILVEVKLNTTGKKRVFRSWTERQFNFAAMFLENGKDLPPASIPLGRKPNTGLPLQQPLPEDGTPVRDVLLFAAPPASAGEMSLRLDGDRCGEPGDIWFKIPASALKKN